MLRQIAKILRCTRDYLMYAGWLERIVIGLASLMLTFIPAFLVSYWLVVLFPVVAVLTLRLISVVTAQVTECHFRWLTKDEYNRNIDRYVAFVSDGVLPPDKAATMFQTETGCLYLDYWASPHTRDYLAEFYGALADRNGWDVEPAYRLARGPYDSHGNIV